MTGKITLAAVATAALVVVGACSRGDNSYNDTAAGSTAGAMATPPATYPAAGMSTGATTGATTGVVPTDTTDTTAKQP